MGVDKPTSREAKEYLAAFEKWMHSRVSWDASARAAALSVVVKKYVTPRRECTSCGAPFAGSGNRRFCLRCRPPPRRRRK